MPNEGEFTHLNVVIVTEIMLKVVGILKWSNLSVWSWLWQQTSDDLFCCFSNIKGFQQNWEQNSSSDTYTEAIIILQANQQTLPFKYE